MSPYKIDSRVFRCFSWRLFYISTFGEGKGGEFGFVTNCRNLILCSHARMRIRQAEEFAAVNIFKPEEENQDMPEKTS